MDIIFNSEEELEVIIFGSMFDGAECPIDNEVWDYYYRQPAIGSYGTADILKFRKSIDLDENDNPYIDSIDFCVVELKKEYIDEKSISQCLRYKQGVISYFNKMYPSLVEILNVTCQVVAPKIKYSGDCVFLLNNIPTDILQCYEVGFGCKGLEFNLVGDSWKISNDSCQIDTEVHLDVQGAICVSE